MSANRRASGTAASELLVVEYEGRKAYILRNPSYEQTIASIQRAFPKLLTLVDSPSREITLSALFPELGEAARITESTWDTVLPSLTRIRVDVRTCPWAKIGVKTVTGETLTMHVNLTADTVEDIKEILYFQDGIPPEQQRLIFTGKQLEDRRTLRDCNIRADSILHYVLRLRAGKPIIYLFPPEPSKDIRVELSLVQAWSFSEIYPHTAIKTLINQPNDLGQTISWTVDAKPDGTLLDQSTGREMSYLFWEAYTNPRPPLSPPTTRPNTPSILFDPANPSLSPSQSALLPRDKLTGYIDDVLLALGLHTEARTSFITYWLPDLSKHTYIALRFLAQAEYEQAAPLNITPAPNVTTRVFMLFGGIDPSQIELWDEAVTIANKDVEIWRDIIGIDSARARDKSLFRVLEWGGMEVNLK